MIAAAVSFLGRKGRIYDDRNEYVGVTLSLTSDNLALPVGRFKLPKYNPV